MKRSILIAGGVLSLALGAAAIAQTTNETVTNPGTSTMQRAEDPANNAGLPGGVQPGTMTTPAPTGSTAASTTDQSGMAAPMSSSGAASSAGSYGYNSAATEGGGMSSSSGASSGGMAGERG